MPTSSRRLTFTLLVLLGINTMNFFDRQVLGAVGEPVREELGLNDRQLGDLGTAFILLYAVVGVPMGLWTDIGRRTVLLAGGAAAWSIMTALSGLARGFPSLYATRLGVGLGEACCAPAATSLLGDLFPRERRARAVSIFMLGLPVGLGLSFIVSGSVAQHWGWRAAFFVAAGPGLILAILSLFIPEPVRGTAEEYAVGTARRPGSAILLVLRTPTMWWIIASGILHNFNMYAIGTFLSPYLQRYHGLNTQQAGWVSGVVYGCFGGLGIFLGGWACDRSVRRRVSGRLEVSAAAILISVPCLFLALQRPQGAIWTFFPCMLTGCLFLYVYYPAVYATIQDITEPSLRGTAMAVYFCAMYLLGAALGPAGTGRVSDYFARQALASGLSPDAARAVGLNHAMYLVPILCAVLVLVLVAAARTVPGDYARLQKWLEANVAGAKEGS